MAGYSLKVAESVLKADERSPVGRLGRECLTRDIPITEVAASLGVSRQTVYNWVLGVRKPLPYHTAAILIWLGSLPTTQH